MSPVSCMNACGKRWHIAGIQNGNVCLCSKYTPPTYVSDSFCNSTCTGTNGYSEDPKCGGNEHLSVYNISKRIIGLEIVDLPVLDLYSTANIRAKTENGEGINYVFQTGDGRTETTTQSSITHIYNEPGNFKVI